MVKFTTKYDDVEKSTITKVDAKTDKTVEITSIIDAKIDPTIKSSTKVLENQDYSHLDFGEPINYEFTNLMIRNIPEFEKEKRGCLRIQKLNIQLIMNLGLLWKEFQQLQR